MDNNVRDQIKRGRSVVAWKTTHPTLFASGKALSLITAVGAAIDQLVSLGADQESAGGQSLAGTAGVNSLVDAVRADLVAFTGTARTIRRSGASLPFDFLPPSSNANDVIIATGESFYLNASAPEVKAQFLDWGMASDFLTDLRADLDAYEGKVANRDQSTQQRKDAVAQIDAQEEILINAIDGLDTVMKNTLRADPSLLGSWREAAKLVRTRVHPKLLPPVAKPA